MKWGFFICSLLSGCITHVSDSFFDKAEYEAYGDTTVIHPDNDIYILSDGQDYYIELPRIRDDRRATTSEYGALRGMAYYSIRDEKISGVKDLYRLPKQQALYLIGKNKNPSYGGVLVYIENRDEIKAKCTQKIPVRQAPDNGTFCKTHHTVTSPHATVFNTLGYATAAVVDVPLSCAGTASAVAINAIVWPVYFIISPSDAASAFSADFGSHAWQRFVELK